MGDPAESSGGNTLDNGDPNSRRPSVRQGGADLPRRLTRHCSSRRSSCRRVFHVPHRGDKHESRAGSPMRSTEPDVTHRPLPAPVQARPGGRSRPGRHRLSPTVPPRSATAAVRALPQPCCSPARAVDEAAELSTSRRWAIPPPTTRQTRPVGFCSAAEYQSAPLGTGGTGQSSSGTHRSNFDQLSAE
jgi:hypothetical protein